ncbi:hypothetical protein ACIQXI_14210 [Lysinibacillus sp. NPDC097195]
MREAWHTNEERLYILPQNLPVAEVENHKQIAKKGPLFAHTAKRNYM